MVHATPASYTASSFLPQTECKAGALSHSRGFKPRLLSAFSEALGIQLTSLSFNSPSRMMEMTNCMQGHAPSKSTCVQCGRVSEQQPGELPLWLWLPDSSFIKLAPRQPQFPPHYWPTCPSSLFLVHSVPHRGYSLSLWVGQCLSCP